MVLESKDLSKMRKDAQDIFLAGVEAVEAEAAVRRHCKVQDNRLAVDERVYDLSAFQDIYVIGAGKAGASMAKAVSLRRNQCSGRRPRSRSASWAGRIMRRWGLCTS